MELDELKACWQKPRPARRRAHCDQSQAADRDHHAQGALEARAGAWLVRCSTSLIGGVFRGGLSGAFWTAHLATPPVAVAGIALHAASIGLIVIGVVRLVLVLRIDFTQPVLAIQRSLASLQEWEARSFHAVWLGCWLLVPAARSPLSWRLAGVDLWERASGYVLANLLVCLVGRACALLLHLWARRRGGRLAAWMDGFLTSHSIARASAAIAEIDEFARPVSELTCGGGTGRRLRTARA